MSDAPTPLVTCGTCGKPSLVDELNACPEHFRWERLMADRCPVCGSDDTYPCDYAYNPDTGDEWPTGTCCDVCHYDSDRQYARSLGVDRSYDPPPYRAPGEPGSHDRLEEYVEVAAPGLPAGEEE